MIRNKVTLTIPGWQNSAMRTCWENQFFMSGAGWKKHLQNGSWLATLINI